jgi:hypothetical protein
MIQCQIGMAYLVCSILSNLQLLADGNFVLLVLLQSLAIKTDFQLASYVLLNAKDVVCSLGEVPVIFSILFNNPVSHMPNDMLLTENCDVLVGPFIQLQLIMTSRILEGYYQEGMVKNCDEISP